MPQLQLPTRDERIAELKLLRDAYIKEELRILNHSQSYTIAGQSVQRSLLDSVRKGRREAEAEITALLGGARQIRRVVPVDD